MRDVVTGERWLTGQNKRRFDFAFSTLFLGPALGVSVIAASALYVETPKKPWFKQSRVGQDGKLFETYKLRTMLSTHFYDVSGGHNDERATRLGRILRGPGIDELPQLLNVALGNMSIVGPRPLPTVAVDGMRDILSDSEFDDWYRAYTLPKPGLTSQFSVASRSLETQSDEYLRTRAEMDVDYLESASLRTDIQTIYESGLLAVRGLTTV